MADVYFVEYTFRNIRTRIQQEATGSVQDNINLETLNRLLLPLPPLPIQKRIAAILGALDDKIEANRRMNETLEGIARALFKSWFVDFDPVHAKAAGRQPLGPPFADADSASARASFASADALRPMREDVAALFPDSFQGSELGPIPKGWEVKALDEIADFLNGQAMQKYPAVEDEPDWPVIKIAELRSGFSANTQRANRSVPDKYIIRDGDIVFSWSGSLLCKVWTQGEGALNQHLFKVTSDIYPSGFALHCVLAHLDEFQHIAASKATTMGHIKREHLSAALCVVPTISVLEQWSNQIDSLIELCVSKAVESRRLASVRDALLPKLLSGELSVDAAEETVEGVV